MSLVVYVACSVYRFICRLWTSCTTSAHRQTTQTWRATSAHLQTTQTWRVTSAHRQTNQAWRATSAHLLANGRLAAQRARTDRRIRHDAQRARTDWPMADWPRNERAPRKMRRDAQRARTEEKKKKERSVGERSSRTGVEKEDEDKRREWCRNRN